MEEEFIADEFDPEDIYLADEQKEKSKTASADAQRAFLEARRLAYVEVFSEGHTSKHALAVVLKDVLGFTRAFASRFDTSERVHCLLEGRAEVAYRILDHKNLTLDEMFVKYTNQNRS